MKATTRPEPDILPLLENGFNEETARSLYAQGEAVVIFALKRKNSYCNRSEVGAETQAVLMSVFRTLKQRGFQGTDCVVDALRQYFATKKLPKLPKTTQTAE